MTQSPPTSNILIVDDHPLVREGIALQIGMFPDLRVCGEAETEDEAFSLVQQISPDLIIIDISLKSGHGLELIKRIKSLNLSVKMLVVTGFQESLYAERVLRAGALGYLSKQESNAKLITAIRTVLKGQRYVSAEITQRLVERALGNRDTRQSPIEQLTDRELEIFRLIGEGMTSGQIAGLLFLSTHTIDTHRENIKRKLDCKNAGELNRHAIQWLLENE